MYDLLLRGTSRRAHIAAGCASFAGGITPRHPSMEVVRLQSVGDCDFGGGLEKKQTHRCHHGGGRGYYCHHRLPCRKERVTVSVGLFATSCRLGVARGGAGEHVWGRERKTDVCERGGERTERRRGWGSLAVVFEAAWSSSRLVLL